jgi:hypothetical protein
MEFGHGSLCCEGPTNRDLFRIRGGPIGQEGERNEESNLNDDSSVKISEKMALC